MIASINMSPEEIKISAPKISLEGLVTVNGYFKIKEDGTMEATGGKIAGWTIGQGALFTGQNTAEIAPILYLGTANLLKATAIAGSAARKDWRQKIAANYGVASDGSLYAENGYFRGSVEAGKIKYNVDESGRNAGTFNGGGITINTVTPAQLDREYASALEVGNLQATVADIQQLLAGNGSISSLYVSKLYYKGSAPNYNLVKWMSPSGANSVLGN